MTPTVSSFSAWSLLLVNHGGALVSKIHSRTKHGDPHARHFTNQILEEVSKPFFHTLQRWIISGELHDPFNEFFVQVNPDVISDDPSPYGGASGDAGFEQGFDLGGGVSDSHHIWEKKYIYVKGMVPGFINEDFAKKVRMSCTALTIDLLHRTKSKLYSLQLL